MARKKNAGSLGFSEFALEKRPFLSWAGETQQRYERLRGAALSGEGDALFELGTAFFAPQGTGSTRGIWQLRRQRAPVRSGNFSLGELLVECGAVDRALDRNFFGLQHNEVRR